VATHSTVWSGVMSTAVSAIAVAYAVVRDTDGKYRVATTANRASYGRSRGIAITAASTANPAFEYQVAGVLSEAVSGIGTGAAGDWVRVTAAGALERTATVSSGDDVIGRCPTTTAEVQVNPGVWDSDNASGGGGGGTPGGSDTQLQYNNGGSLGGISGATTDGTTLTLTDPVIDHIAADTGHTVSVGGDGVKQTSTAFEMSGVPRIGVPGSGTYGGVNFPEATPYSSEGYVAVVVGLLTDLTVSAEQAAVSCLEFTNASAPFAAYFPQPTVSNGEYPKDVINNSGETVTLCVNDAQPSLLTTVTLADGERGRFWFRGDGVVGTSGGLSVSGTPAEGDVPRWNGSAAEWEEPVELPVGTTAGDLLFVGPGLVLARIPIGTAGQVLTVNATADGYEWTDGGGGGPGVFDPATLALTGWWRGYASSPWGGTTSAGTSDTEALSEGTNPPSAGTTVNGHAPADFDGTNDRLLADIGGNIDDFYNAGTYSGWALVYADSVATDSTDPYSNDAILSAQGASFYGVYLRSSGLVGLYHYDTGWTKVETAFSTGGWHLVQWKANGTTMKIRVDSGSWASQAAGSIADVTNRFVLGENWNGGAHLNGKILDLGLIDSVLTDAEFDDIVAYVNDRYALSL
jgi:hypothetical protein